jgi:hypothetical protein
VASNRSKVGLSVGLVFAVAKGVRPKNPVKNEDGTNR